MNRSTFYERLEIFELLFLKIANIIEKPNTLQNFRLLKLWKFILSFNVFMWISKIDCMIPFFKSPFSDSKEL